MFKRVLVANRGEIACRIIKTLNRLGIGSVAIYSQHDANALHVKQADSAFLLEGNTLAETYLNQTKIIEIAQNNSVDAIHPGYGFLSENADFVKAVEESGLIFIGPSSQTVDLMGDKQRAKNSLEAAGVPLIPGYHQQSQTLKDLTQAATKIGFPVLIKAASGGGGKAMHVVNDGLTFKEKVAQAQREARNSFGDDCLILEKYLMKPRHIEIQIAADKHNHYVSLGSRECSVQRRNQKIIEEAPAPGLNSEVLAELESCALNIAQFINYEGIGTLEFLLDEQNHFYFLEMNTRIQVEHPVTELVTGVDLVEWQLLIASNQVLPQLQVAIKGHAIEARVYAEDALTLLPAVGTIQYLNEPETQLPHLRVDTGIAEGDNISVHYDSMLTKVITFDLSRELARLKCLQALSLFHLVGVKTNLCFLSSVLQTEAFINAKVDTQFVEHNLKLLTTTIPCNAAWLCAAVLIWLLKREDHSCYPQALSSWRLNLHYKEALVFQCEQQSFRCAVEKKADSYVIFYDGMLHQVHGSLQSDRLELFLDGEKRHYNYVLLEHSVYLFQDMRVKQFECLPAVSASDDAQELAGGLSAPMPGLIVDIKVHPGKKVQAGEPLIILEAMKMEHSINAPCAGTVKTLMNQVGDLVSEGQALLSLDKND